MTEQHTPGAELELRREAPVATVDTDSWMGVVENVALLAQRIAGTEFVPRDLRGKPAATAAAILYGREVGLPPMTALTQTHVIEGKPSTSAEGMRALILAAGHELVFVEATTQQVTMRARRRHTETWTELTWTLDMARNAGLVAKDNWRKYPRAMLTARCTDELAGMVFPDVIHGLRVVEAIVDDLGEQEPEPELATVRSPAKKAAPRKRTPRKAAEPAHREDGGLPLPGEEGYAEERPPAAAGGSAAGETPELEPEKPREKPQEPPQGPESPEAAPEAVEPESGAQGPQEVELDEDGAVEAEIVEGPEERGTAVNAETGVETPPGEPLPEIVDETPAEGEGPRVSTAQISRAQSRMLHAAFGKLEKDSVLELPREEKLRLVTVLAGRTEPITTTDALTKTEASAVIDSLARISSLEELMQVVDDTESARRGEGS